MKGFFKRWVYLLSFFILLSIVMGVVSYLSWQNYYDKYYSPISDDCYEYLLSKDDNWTLSGDYYYQTECDLQNPYSKQSVVLKTSSNIGDKDDFYIYVTFLLFGLLAVSFLIRWLLTGQLKLEK